jgi:hypothetical protein
LPKEGAESNTARKAGWRVIAWSDAVGCSRSYTYILIKTKRIESVLLGRSRIITTAPADFLKSLER